MASKWNKLATNKKIDWRYPICVVLGIRPPCPRPPSPAQFHLMSHKTHAHYMWWHVLLVRKIISFCWRCENFSVRLHFFSIRGLSQGNVGPPMTPGCTMMTTTSPGDTQRQDADILFWYLWWVAMSKLWIENDDFGYNRKSHARIHTNK